MNIVLLSGGSGTRLWPLSNDVRSKQFLEIFKTNDGYESMLQRMYRMFKSVEPNASITIATAQNQASIIKAQLGDSVNISIEPSRRDTFPAIALACSLLKKNGAKLDEPIVICPVDPMVDESYFQKIYELGKIADNSEYNLTLMGIKPTYPSEKYGYIMTSNGVVTGFKEKPSEEIAKDYINKGALWNGGVFAFKLGYVMEIAEKEFGTSDYDTLFANYDTLKKISFDYAVVEKENSIGYVTYEGEWKDLGTWNTLTEAMSENIRGNATAVDCNNVHVINELNIPLLTLGINDSVVVATPDGILVSDKIKSSSLKEYVKPNRPMFETRDWGEYKVLDSSINSNGENSLTKILIISTGKHISYQYHDCRTEMWTVVEGSGKLIINGEIKKVQFGDSITIPAGTKHAIKADEELHIVEVQIGKTLVEEDIHRLDFDWKSI